MESIDPQQLADLAERLDNRGKFIDRIAREMRIAQRAEERRLKAIDQLSDPLDDGRASRQPLVCKSVSPPGFDAELLRRARRGDSTVSLSRFVASVAAA